MRNLPKREAWKAEVLTLTTNREQVPLLIGPVSIALKQSVETAEALLDEMVAEGTLRLASEAEKKTFDIRHGYMLVRAV